MFNCFNGSFTASRCEKNFGHQFANNIPGIFLEEKQIFNLTENCYAAPVVTRHVIISLGNVL